MITVTFPESARAALAECLTRPYPSPSAGGELVDRDQQGRHCLVLIEVPTGLDADALIERVAADVMNNLLSGLRSLHNESPDSGETRVVFMPADGVDLERLATDLRASFERGRPAIEARHSQVRAAAADQGVVVALSDDDWFLVHGVLADARARRPADGTVGDAWRLADASLFVDEDE